MNASVWTTLRDSFREMWREGNVPLALIILGVFGVGCVTVLAIVALTLTYALALVGESGVVALLLHPAVTHVATGVGAVWGGWTVGVAVTHRRTERQWREVFGEIGNRYMLYNRAATRSEQAAILAGVSKSRPDDPIYAEKRATDVVRKSIRDVLGKYTEHAAFCATVNRDDGTLDAEAEKKAQEIAWAVAGADVIAPAGDVSL